MSVQDRYGEVSVTRDGHVAVLEIDRPPYNHVSVELMRHLADALDAIDGEIDLRAVVLCSVGKAFCAGADLVAPTGLAGSSGMTTINPLYVEAVRLYSTKKPIVMAVQGAAVGAGLGLALVGDFRIAAPEARFTANFVKLGFHAGFGISHTLPRLIGLQRAALMLETGRGEWLWRPLTNPRSPGVADFSDVNPRGFGLLQRDRRFGSYQDLESSYQLRPSTWVEPVGSWGPGSVRLVELPTPDETSDNVVAFWKPERLPAPGSPISFEYNLHWFLDGIRPPAGLAVSTRHGRSRTQEPELERFVVDFDGERLRRMDFDPGVEPVVTVGKGAELVHATAEKNPYNGTWRVAFALRPSGTGEPVELRCFLRKSPDVLTETWSYLWRQ